MPTIIDAATGKPITVDRLTARRLLNSGEATLPEAIAAEAPKALRLVNKATGEFDRFNARGATAAVSDGTHEFVEDEIVSLVDNSGRQFTLSGPRVEQGIREFGLQVEPEAQRKAFVREQVKEAQFGDRPLSAFSLGALSAGSFGASDLIARGLGLDDEVREITGRSPVASLVGGVGAAVGLALASGGSSLLARGARLTGPGFAASQGARVAGAVTAGTRGLAGGGILARGVARAAPVIAAGATEGALFGAGVGLSNAALSDDPLTAEALFGGIGTGALHGAALGAGVAGVGVAVSGVLRAGARVSSRLAGSTDDIAGQQLAKQAAFNKVTANAQAKTVATAVRKDIEIASTGLSGKLSRLDDQVAKLTKQANKGAKAGRADLLGISSRLKSAKAVLDEFRPAFAASPKAIANAARKAPADFAKAGGALDSYQRAAEEALDAITPGAVLSPRSRPAVDIAKLVDRNLDAATALGTSRLLGSTEDVAEAAAQGFNPSKADLLAVANEVGLPIEDIPIVGGAVDLALKAHLAFRFLGKVAQKTGRSGVLGAAVESVTGRAFGAAGAAGRAARTVFGGADKVIGTVAKKIADAVEGFIGKGLKPGAAVPAATEILKKVRFGETPKPKPVKASVKEKSRELQKLYGLRSAELTQAISSPQALRQVMEDRLQDLRRVNPGLSSQIVDLGERRIQFLSSKLPSRRAALPGGPNIDKYPPADSLIAKFSRYVRASDDITTVLSDLENGTLTREAVETMKELTPNLYAAVQQSLVERMSELREELPYQKRLQLSIFFQVPVESSMRPEFVAIMQAQFAEDEEPPPAQATSIPQAASNRSVDRDITPSQKLLQA